MSNELKELSKEQLDLMPAYKDRWEKIGQATNKPLPSEARIMELFSQAYKAAGLAAPKELYIAKSPRDIATIVNKIRKDKYKEKPLEVEEIIRQCGYGNQDATWLSFYNYFLEVGQVKECETMLPLMNIAKEHIGWYYTAENEVIVATVPTYIKILNEQVHCSTGPAIFYQGDETALYAMYGVPFKGDMIHFVTTPKEDLNPNDVLDIKNVEQRTAVIKKIGFEKVLDSLSPKVIDHETFTGDQLSVLKKISQGFLSVMYGQKFPSVGGDYKLYSITMPNGLERKYLKMENPSVPGDYPFEAVPPEVTTVRQGLAYRTFGDHTAKFVLPDVLT